MANDTLSYNYVPYKNKNRLGTAAKDVTFNKASFRQFIANQDYEGAAIYAGQFSPKNTSERINHEADLNELRKHQARLNKLTQGASDSVREAAQFKYAFDNGLTLPTEFKAANGKVRANSYTEKYRNYIDNLGSSSDGKSKADRLSIRFLNDKNGNFFTRFLNIDKDEDVIDTFINSLNNYKTGKQLNKTNFQKELNAIGVNVIQSSDGYELQFDKSNSHIVDILRAYSESGLDKDKTSIAGISSSGNYIGDVSDRRGKSHFGIRQTRNKFLTDDIVSFVNQVNERAKSPKSRDYQNKEIQSMIISADYNSQVDAVAWQDYCSGRLTEAQYNKVKDHIDKSVLQALGTAFTQNEIYYSDAANDVLHFAEVAERQRLEDLYNIAAKNPEKSMRIHAAKVGNRFGTYVEIFPEGKTDETKSTYLLPGLKIDRSPNSQTIKFFIPDLENGEAMQALYADPKTRAMMQITDMQNYGYDVNTSYKDEKGYNHNISLTYNPATDSYTEKDLDTDRINNISPLEAQTKLASIYKYNDICQQLISSVYDSQGNVNKDYLDKALSFWSANVANWINENYPMMDAQSKSDLGNKLLQEMLNEFK